MSTISERLYKGWHILRILKVELFAQRQKTVQDKLGKKKKCKLQSVVFKKAYATPKYTIAYAWKVPETNMRNCEWLILLFRGNPFCPHVQLEFLTIIMGYSYNFKSSEN